MDRTRELAAIVLFYGRLVRDVLIGTPAAAFWYATILWVRSGQPLATFLHDGAPPILTALSAARLWLLVAGFAYAYRWSFISKIAPLFENGRM